MKFFYLSPQQISRFLFASLAVVIATVAFYWLRERVAEPMIALLYLLPVVISTAAWGLGPGIVTALGAFLAFNFFFIQPYNTLWVHRTQDLVALLVFLAVALATSQIVGRAQSNLAAARTREHETAWLYDLSRALAAHNDAQTIASVLAGQCLVIFRADCVRITLEKTGDNEPCVICQPNQEIPVSKPQWVAPMVTAHGLLGEISIWRANPRGTPAEDRLLQIFANQGALALERTHLLQIATHTRVIEESDRLKSALLSSVSHELRTPLATIKAAVSSLRSGEVAADSEAGRDLLAAVEEETDQLNQLVGNLLNMSRLESGALRPQRESNVLAEIVASALHRLRLTAHSHRITVDVSEDLPLVPVDFGLMEQVLTNLISNSVKYSPEGSAIRITARTQHKKIIKVTVSNQGPPVPESDLPRIFDKFYRITAADRVTGAGLGLSICKGIVEAHGGRIWAENQPDEFAIHFTLPLTDEQRAAHPGN